MKEYNIEKGNIVNIDRLKSNKMPIEDFSKIHQHIPIPTHDVYIHYEDGILLLLRDNNPERNELWPVGGRVNRGMPIKDSLKKKVKEECGLELDDDITEIGSARLFFDTDPFHHGKGTDCIGFIFFAKARGKVSVDNLHAGFRIIKPVEYTEEFRSNLHPCVRDFMDIAIKYVKSEKILRT